MKRALLPVLVLLTACEADTRDLHLESGSDGAVFRADATPDGGFVRRSDGGARDGSFPPDATPGPDSGIIGRDAQIPQDAGDSPCHNLDEATCRASPNCFPATCADCQGGSFFVGCLDPNDPPPPCPGIACPAPCAGLDEATCATAANCHRIYFPNTTYEGCADGEFADCKGESATCDAAPPACEGDFVVSYSGTCYEGCARTEECAP